MLGDADAMLPFRSAQWQADRMEARSESQRRDRRGAALCVRRDPVDSPSRVATLDRFPRGHRADTQDRRGHPRGAAHRLRAVSPSSRKLSVPSSRCARPGGVDRGRRGAYHWPRPEYVTPFAATTQPCGRATRQPSGGSSRRSTPSSMRVESASREPTGSPTSDRDEQPSTLSPTRRRRCRSAHTATSQSTRRSSHSPDATAARCNRGGFVLSWCGFVATGGGSRSQAS